jgi:copper oxidase (laccase) domain-containing protein
VPTAPHESFPALEAIDGVIHTFLGRVPGLDVRTDRETAMARLATIQRGTLDTIGFAGFPLVRAEQVHSNKVARVSEPAEVPLPGCDALVTTTPGLALGIHVADCAAVYLVDRKCRGIGLAHSGRKGTELDIATATLEALVESTGGGPADVIAQISPCIRPPRYEVDFAAEIRRQLARAGVLEIHDCGVCTHAEADVYYSYRREEGKTGRLLAALALRP